MKCELHLGDWRDVVGSWPRPFVLITDPPYGVRHRLTDSHAWRGKDAGGFVHRPREPGPVIAGDSTTAERDAAPEALDWSAAAVFGPRRIDRVSPWGNPREILILDKGPGVGAGDLSLPWKPCWETIAIYGDGWAGPRTTSVLRGSKIAFRAENAPNGRLHPTEKSIVVLRELVAKAPRDLPIVDPFMGSGTTGVAALLADRDFYGAELEQEYFDVARTRLRGIEPPGCQGNLFSECQEDRRG